MSPLEVLSAASSRLEAETTLSILAAAGYVVVPLEPTVPMVLAALDRVQPEGDIYRGIYRAMVAAAEAAL